MEHWKKVTILYSFDSVYNIVDKYDYSSCNYYVSDLGNFRKGNVIRNMKPDAVGTTTHTLTCNSKKHRFKLHQIVMQTFHPEGIRPGYSVDHISRNRLDNRLSNLRWADRETQVENRDNSSEHSKKKVFCVETQEHFNSCREAEIKYGLVKNTVSRAARGERDGIHGYHFVYAD